ncbi:uncharacterized protein LOC117172427 [Belonocnema kinseyi]|uniref:uncharacterized protein LOC117172427 n=1 Tax=Belonocnema kinseyi TaxID=2817044 RepID=UPI00143D7DB7|nr:uncharacterized protein LOC117172427 [Belonocnema kinseyi]
MSRRRSSIASCQQATAGKVCLFCGLTEDNELEYGKLYELGPIVTHYYCLLLSSMMEQRGRDEQGILGFMSADIQKELRRGKRLACFHCKKVGATLGCCNSKCKRIFHLPCGLRNGSLHQFYGEFRSYCINHRPKQLIDSRVVEEVQNAESTLCYICYDNVNYLDILKTLWAPCCKKNAFFHRKCVQQLANSSGYFFKCPLCNNKKEFQEAMLEHGIFIPLQDASWELVPNAYQELLYRHNQCDAETCVCPKGRSHASSNAGPANKWELVLCRMCGSQGIHRHCGHLKWANSAWECSECQSILDKSPIVNRQIREATAAGEAENRDPRSGDLESDSELSVGQDSNQQTENTNDNPDSENLPTVKVRPGPLSYKMKEVMKVAQSRQMTKDSSSSLEGTNSLTSLTESENGDNKNIVVDDPNTVILLDSDEEPEDIEIISEKLNPKVLTTNDGRKIEIFDMKRHAEQQAKVNNIGNESSSAESAARLSSDSAERLSADSANVANSSPQKDSKPTITSIQTMKNASSSSSSPHKISGDKSLQSRANADTGDSTILSRMLASPNQLNFLNQAIANPKFVSPHALPHESISPGTTSQNPREIRPKSLLEDNPRIQNSASTLQNPRGANPNSQISNLKFITNTRILNPPIASPQFRPNLLQRQTNPILTPPRQLNPQTFNERLMQVWNQRNTTPENNVPSPVKSYPTPSPSKQENTSPTKNVAGFVNPEVKTARALPSNAPQFIQPKVLEEESSGIQISSICSLDLQTFENWETETTMVTPKKEETGDFQFKRKAETPGPSQYFERQPVDPKRTRISDPGSFTSVGNEIKTEVKIQGGEIKYQSGGKDLNFRSIYSREFVENKDGEKKGRYMLLKRNLVAEALAKANITQSDMVNAGMTAASNQPSTSSVNITSNNYIALPQSNMTFYMGNGESQEVVNIAGKKEGGCISWDSNSVTGMQAPVLLQFSPDMVFHQSPIPPTKSEFEQKIKAPRKQILKSEATHSKTPNSASYAAQSQKAAMSSQKPQAPVIQLD